MCDFKNRTLSLKSFELYNDNEAKEMERPSIATVLKCENEEMIEYYYEGRLTPDFTNAGIIQFDKQILIEVSNMCGNIDFTDEAVSFYNENKMRIIKICEYPQLSAYYEYCNAIYAFAYIIERYFHTKELPRKIFCLSESDLNFLKENEDLINFIGNISILN